MDRNQEFWISELGRIHNRSTEAINADQLSITEELAKNFNELVANLKQEYPDKDVIDSTNSIPGTQYHHDIDDFNTKLETLSMIRNRCERVAQGLNIELRDSADEADPEKMNEDMTMVHIENSQNSMQSVDTDLNVSTHIESGPWNDELKDELHEVVEEYQNELDTDEPDKSKLRQLLKEMGDYSVPLAANMAVKALQRGILAILSL